MSDNPYASPEEVIPPTEDAVAKGKRPLGVSILAVLNLLAGGVSLLLPFVMLANLSEMEEATRVLGVLPAMMIGGIAFLAAIYLASGIGMWIGARWGWWVGAFNYVYAIFRDGWAVLQVALLAEEFEAIEQDQINFQMFKFSVRAFLSLLLVLYFFKANVLAFFGLKALNKIKAAAILVGISLAIFVAASTVNFLLLPNTE